MRAGEQDPVGKEQLRIQSVIDHGLHTSPVTAMESRKFDSEEMPWNRSLLGLSLQLGGF